MQSIKHLAPVPQRRADDDETRARKAALEYMAAAASRFEQLQLSDRMLARKFECAPSTIKRTKAHGRVSALSEVEQQLVRQCAREHDRLERENRKFTKQYLAVQYNVPVCAINRQLQILGFENPLNRKNKDRRAAA